MSKRELGSEDSHRQAAPEGLPDPRSLAPKLAGLSPADRFRRLDSTPSGLSSEAVRARRERDGWNDPVAPAARHRLVPLLRNFTHTLALLLWFAAGLALAARIYELAFAVVAVIAVNGVFAAAQEYRAEQVVEGLMRRVAVRSRVLRDGTWQVLPARDLVRGDVVALAAGDIVPADGVLVEGDEVTLDLSMITGETVPVGRTPEVASAEPEAHVSEVPAIAPAGAAVVTGSATALVWATGPTSTLGQIASLVESVQRGESTLERQVRALSWTTAVIAVLTGTGTLALATAFTDTSFVSALTFATGVIVALVPEGMLPTLSVALAIGARRMAERGAAVRRLAAVEIVGSATVICTDKTGTLTENVLSVLGVDGVDGQAVRASTRAGLAAGLCNNARLEGDGRFTGDPIDVALAEWMRAGGMDLEALRARSPRLSETPFDAHLRLMTTTHLVDGHATEFIKGAPEAVLATLETEPTPALRAALDAAAEAGERVLLLASRPEGSPARIEGLVRFFDPPRHEVPGAIAACRAAGIGVVMLTGDHPATARFVASQVGLEGDGGLPVIEGATLDRMGDQAVMRVLRGNAIFARIHPEQKLRIVRLLRQSGAVVVVTGDGINDAPALRAADVGVAMGRRGTEVAKQAADIVLADDNFATLVAAIEEGRSLKRNIRRFVSYVFTSNVAEVMPFLCYVFLQVPLPLAVIQALAIDVGTDLAPALALGAEPPAAATMQSPPELPGRPLMTRRLATRTFLVFGLIEAALGLAAYLAFYAHTGWRPFADLDDLLVHEASTLTFLGIVGGQVGCLFAQRDGSLRRRLSFRSNRLLGIGLASELLLAPVLVYVPGLNQTFQMAPVPAPWLLAIPVCAIAFLGLDLLRRSIEGRAEEG
ncbi:MAG: cation-transporting P-type ATPase [Dehalococcoidia bacterium]